MENLCVAAALHLYGAMAIGIIVYVHGLAIPHGGSGPEPNPRMEKGPRIDQRSRSSGDREMEDGDGGGRPLFIAEIPPSTTPFLFVCALFHRDLSFKSRSFFICFLSDSLTF